MLLLLVVFLTEVSCANTFEYLSFLLLTKYKESKYECIFLWLKLTFMVTVVFQVRRLCKARIFFSSALYPDTFFFPTSNIKERIQMCFHFSIAYTNTLQKIGWERSQLQLVSLMPALRIRFSKDIIVSFSYLLMLSYMFPSNTRQLCQ